MSFYHYSNSQPTLDLRNPEHVDLIRQFIVACKTELERRRRRIAQEPRNDVSAHDDGATRSHASANGLRRRTAGVT